MLNSKYYTYGIFKNKKFGNFYSMTATSEDRSNRNTNNIIQKYSQTAIDPHLL